MFVGLTLGAAASAADVHREAMCFPNGTAALLHAELDTCVTNRRMNQRSCYYSFEKSMPMHLVGADIA